MTTLTAPRASTRSRPSVRVRDVEACIVEIGDLRHNANRSPYRVVMIAPARKRSQELVILKKDGMIRNGIMDALMAAFAAGHREFSFKLTNFETGMSRRIESFEIIGGPAATAAQPVAEAPAQGDLLTDVVEPTPVPVQSKRYNTSDGGDRLVLRIPAGTQISDLFQGSGSFTIYRNKTQQMVLLPAVKESKLKFRSGQTFKDGSRDVYFTGLKRYATAAKLNAPVRQFTAIPYNDGLKLQAA